MKNFKTCLFWLALAIAFTSVNAHAKPQISANADVISDNADDEEEFGGPSSYPHCWTRTMKKLKASNFNAVVYEAAINVHGSHKMKPSVYQHGFYYVLEYNGGAPIVANCIGPMANYNRTVYIYVQLLGHSPSALLGEHAFQINLEVPNNLLPGDVCTLDAPIKICKIQQTP